MSEENGSSELGLVLEALALDKRLREQGVDMHDVYANLELRARTAEARVAELEEQIARITGGLRDALVAIQEETVEPRILDGEVG